MTSLGLIQGDVKRIKDIFERYTIRVYIQESGGLTRPESKYYSLIALHTTKKPYISLHHIGVPLEAVYY